MDILVQEINDFYRKHRYWDSHISSDISIRKIHNLFFQNVFVEPNNTDEYLNYGKYYKIKNDSDNAIKYLSMAIEKGNSDAMDNLGRYYEEKEDYENMMKYYLMAIAENNSNAMVEFRLLLL